MTTPNDEEFTFLAVVKVQYAPDQEAARRALEETLIGLSLNDFEPGAWVPDATVTDRQHIEVIHNRHPDEGCEVQVFVSGHPAQADVYDIDPGRGYVRADWDETTDSLCASASREVAERLRPLRNDAADNSPYVQPRP
jgi:hypothetical protein